MKTMITRFFVKFKKKRVSEWLQFGTPILMGLLTVLLIIHILHFGGPRESLAARAESEIMRFSLANTAKPIHSPSPQVISFSVSDSDLMTLPRAPNPALNDAHITEYANVLSYVSRFNPQWVVLSWLTHAHPMTPEYLAPLTSLIDRLQLRDRVTIAINFFAIGNIDSNFSKRHNVVEARDCYHDINLHCTYSQDWSWMPQQIFSRFLREPRNFISTNLPHHLPNIVLNLPTLTSLSNFNFTDAREPVAGAIPSNAIVFIGNQATQDVMFRDNKEVLQRSFTAQSSPRRSLQQDGTPWHIFWAAMTAMFIESRALHVAPGIVISGLAVLCGLLIFSLAFRRIDRLTFITPVSIISSLLLLNLLTISTFHYYLPITPILITCITAIPSAIFLMGALNNYKKWKLLAVARRADESGDLKQNFLQLISHNLNTPIAQLKGLLEILSADSPDILPLSRALILTDYVRITAKAALATSAAPTRITSTQRRTLRSVIDGFLDDEAGFLKRMKLEVNLRELNDEIENSVWSKTLALDFDLISNCLISGVILQVMSTNCSHVMINAIVTPGPEEDEDVLHISLQTSGNRPQDSHLDPPPFMRETIERYLDAVLAAKLISFRSTDSEATISFKPRSDEHP
jgi:signal transduction histidine kinase